jgi:hypothetical protein
MALFQYNNAAAFHAGCNYSESGFECFLPNKTEQKIYWDCFNISCLIHVAIPVLRYKNIPES